MAYLKVRSDVIAGVLMARVSLSTQSLQCESILCDTMHVRYCEEDLVPHAASRTVLTSHSDTVLSAELVATVLEKGRKCTAFTESVWPLRVATHCPLQGGGEGMFMEGVATERREDVEDFSLSVLTCGSPTLCRSGPCPQTPQSHRSSASYSPTL